MDKFFLIYLQILGLILATACTAFTVMFLWDVLNWARGRK